MSYADEEADDPLDDAEDPSDADVGDEDDEVDTHRCPHCRKMVYEQAEVCPHCGSYIGVEDAPPRKSWWFVITVLLCLAAIIVGWVFTRWG